MCVDYKLLSFVIFLIKKVFSWGLSKDIILVIVELFHWSWKRCCTFFPLHYHLCIDICNFCMSLTLSILGLPTYFSWRNLHRELSLLILLLSRRHPPSYPFVCLVLFPFSGHRHATSIGFGAVWWVGKREGNRPKRYSLPLPCLCLGN